MLFRRFSQHIKEQNWFAVALDFLIVVSGIFIGLQVDAWNELRGERVLEQQYLQRLLSDMEASIEAQQSVFAENQVGIASLDRLAEKLRSGDMGPPDTQIFSEGMNFLGWVFPPTTNLVTVRELQSTGNISLIRDIEIREAIGQLELSYADAQYRAEQTSILLSTLAPATMEWSYVKPDPGSTDGYTMTPEYGLLESQPYAGNIISLYSGWNKYHQTILEQHSRDTIALRDLVKSALEGTER